MIVPAFRFTPVPTDPMLSPPPLNKRLEEDDKEATLEISRVPPDKVVVPEKLFVPLSDSVPVPDLVKPRIPVLPFEMLPL